MQKLVLDGSNFRNMEEIHAYLKQELQFPDYYGKNLDALWDMLSTYSSPLNITLVQKEHLLENLGNDGTALIQLLDDVARENPNIKLK